MPDSVVGTAADLFKRGKLVEAYALYREAAARYGEKNFAVNLNLCRKGMDRKECAAPEESARRPRVSLLLSSPQNLRYLDGTTIGRLAGTYQLNLFFNSDDGIRPLHDRALLDLHGNELLRLNGVLQLPPSDYWLTLSPASAFTLRDVESYLSEGQKGSSPFSPLEAEMLPVIPGRVSVIIPTFRRPLNLRLAVDSVARQSYADKEVIVVDDNGLDGSFGRETREIIDSLAEKYPETPIRLLQHRVNRNGAAARNSGLMQASGEYICFLDDDDVYLNGRLTKSIEALRMMPPSCGAVYCGYRGWNSTANDPLRYPRGDLTLEILLLEYERHYLHTNTLTYRREAVFALNGFDETFRRHQDLEFNLRFFEGFTVDVVKEILVQLGAAPTSVHNRVANQELIDLKLKFLTRFRSVISRFDPDTVCRIHLKHLDEIATKFQGGA